MQIDRLFEAVLGHLSTDLRVQSVRVDELVWICSSCLILYHYYSSGYGHVPRQLDRSTRK